MAQIGKTDYQLQSDWGFVWKGYFVQSTNSYTTESTKT